MKQHKIAVRVPVGILVGIFLLGTSLRAQDPPRVVTVGLTTFGKLTPVRQLLLSEIRRNLEKVTWVRVVGLDKNPNCVVTLQVKSAPAGPLEQKILAVAVEQSFPENWLHYLAKQEVPYKILPSWRRKKLPSKGKWVRQYVTREMFQNYRNLLDLKVYGFQKATLSDVGKQAAQDVLFAMKRVFRFEDKNRR